MATISFYADEMLVQNLNGSGLGFFGSSFGQSVEVGEYQDRTYITDGNGLSEGGAIENTKYVHPSSGLNSTVGLIHLQDLPNRVATLNIRFTHDTDVKLQNSQLRIYDRSNINNPASGVVTKVAQIIHPNPVQTSDQSGSGDATWATPGGSGAIVTLYGSPGYSGVHAKSTTHESTIHDYYVVLSASPTTIGAKTLFALYCECEYL